MRAAVVVLREQGSPQRLQARMVSVTYGNQVRVVERCPALIDRHQMMHVELGMTLASDQPCNGAAVAVPRERALAGLIPEQSVVDAGHGAVTSVP